MHGAHDDLELLAEGSRDLIKQIDQFKLAEKAHRDGGGKRRRASLLKALEEPRAAAVEQLKLGRYFHREPHWLLSRFPDAELAAVPGALTTILGKLIRRSRRDTPSRWRPSTDHIDVADNGKSVPTRAVSRVAPCTNRARSSAEIASDRS